MKRTIGSYEAKTKLPSLLDQVEKGESFTITKRGRPVAVLSPIDQTKQETLDEVVEGIKELRKANTLGGISLKKLIETGRK